MFKDVFALAVGLFLLVVLLVTLWNAGDFFRNFSGNYGEFTSQSQTPIGNGPVPVAVTEEELWKSTNPTMPGPSPYKGKVRIDPWDSDASTDDAAAEYLSVRASATNGEAIQITKWSVESLVSRTRYPLPQGELLIRLGVPDSARKNVPIYLAPGEYAYIVSGSSPVGGSFHTNACIGQLMNYHAFYPRLPDSCPATPAILPATIENIRNMGEQCIEYISTIPSCEIPNEQSIPEDLLPACKAHIREELTYNKCIDRELKKDRYALYNYGGWYIYLNESRDVWRSDYEILRILDDSGRVVDVWSY